MYVCMYVYNALQGSIVYTHTTVACELWHLNMYLYCNTITLGQLVGVAHVCQYTDGD